jgi:prevent-host-death family protein
MRYSTRVRPISYLKANAAEVLAELAELREPLVITQHGEAKAVVQDIASYEQTQETLALLKILALGQQDVEAGRAICSTGSRVSSKPSPSFRTGAPILPSCWRSASGISARPASSLTG